MVNDIDPKNSLYVRYVQETIRAFEHNGISGPHPNKGGQLLSALKAHCKDKGIEIRIERRRYGTYVRRIGQIEDDSRHQG